jgi:F0F1-type ATP synthase membrane subunit c/vacuolar-type H+-ATPase subunit K
VIVSQDHSFSLRAPDVVAPLPVVDDSPRGEVETRGAGGDFFSEDRLPDTGQAPFADATTPSTTPTANGTTPSSTGNKPALTPAQQQDIANAIVGGVEDIAAGFGIGQGSAATQQRNAAAQQAAFQQQLIVGAVVVVVIGVVLWKLDFFSSPSAPAASG